MWVLCQSLQGVWSTLGAGQKEGDLVETMTNTVLTLIRFLVSLLTHQPVAKFHSAALYIKAGISLLASTYFCSQSLYVSEYYTQLEQRYMYIASCVVSFIRQAAYNCCEYDEDIILNSTTTISISCVYWLRTRNASVQFELSWCIVIVTKQRRVHLQELVHCKSTMVKIAITWLSEFQMLLVFTQFVFNGQAYLSGVFVMLCCSHISSYEHYTSVLNSRCGSNKAWTHY